MEVGIIGLGKMGHGLACNLKDHGYTVFGFDTQDSSVKRAHVDGIQSFSAIKAFTEAFSAKKIIILLIPSGTAVDTMLETLSDTLQKGDIVIDAGNSHYKDSIRRYEKLKAQGVGFLDCGTSGGPSGARNGACTMIGGDKAVYDEVKTIFSDVSVEKGSLYVGKAGSGHFVKMIHNGIEYGMMQAIVEGYEILHKSDFDLNLEEISVLWNNGSVIRSWLIELLGNALAKNPDMNGVKGIVNASGEGKWTVETALELEVPAPVIALSLMMRNRSLESDTYSGKLLASLRNEFGGHAITT